MTLAQHDCWWRFIALGATGNWIVARNLHSRASKWKWMLGKGRRKAEALKCRERLWVAMGSVGQHVLVLQSMMQGSRGRRSSHHRIQAKARCCFALLAAVPIRVPSWTFGSSLTSLRAPGCSSPSRHQCSCSAQPTSLCQKLGSNREGVATHSGRRTIPLHDSERVLPLLWFLPRDCKAD